MGGIHIRNIGGGHVRQSHLSKQEREGREKGALYVRTHTCTYAPTPVTQPPIHTHLEIGPELLEKCVVHGGEQIE